MNFDLKWAFEIKLKVMYPAQKPYQSPSPAQQAGSQTSTPQRPFPPQTNQPVRSVSEKEKPKLSFLDQQDLRDILMEIGRVLLMTQIYKVNHPIVQEKISKLGILMIKIADSQGRLVLSTREDLVFLNGYQEKVTGGPLQKLTDTLKHLKVASFEFEKGITDQEIASFFGLVASLRRAEVSGDIKAELKKAGLVHVKPIFLQYIEVEDIPRDVPKPKNVIEGTKHSFEKGNFQKEEQLLRDFLQGKISELPEKFNSFLLKHPKLAAMVIIKLMDEYEAQNLDSFSAFQAYVQSMSHYMARLSRLIKNPDKAGETLRKLEKHLVVRLKSLNKDRKFINEAKKQVKDAITWVEAERLLNHYEKARERLTSIEMEIIESIKSKKIPSEEEFKSRLKNLGVFQSKISSLLQG